MHPFNFRTQKPYSDTQVQYLILKSEPEDRFAIDRPVFYYQNRYLAKRRMLRRLRQLRRDLL